MNVQRLATIVLSIIVSLMACLTLASCGASSPDGYLATDTTHVYFIQFTNKNGQLNGNLQEVEETSDVPPQVKSFTVAFTGTQNGSSITLTFSVFFFSSSVTGTLNGDTLILTIPQQDGHLVNETFNAASIDAYNQAVDALRKNVSKTDQQYYNIQATATAIQVTQTARQEEQQAVSNANSQLGNELSTLKSDANTFSSFSETTTLNEYAKDWQKMQEDYTTEQKNAQAGWW